MIWSSIIYQATNDPRQPDCSAAGPDPGSDFQRTSSRFDINVGADMIQIAEGRSKGRGTVLYEVEPIIDSTGVCSLTAVAMEMGVHMPLTLTV